MSVLTDSEMRTDTEALLEGPPGEGEPLKAEMSGTNRNSRHEEPLLLLANVALAPSCGRLMSCFSPEVNGMGNILKSIQLQLEFLLNKAGDLQDCLTSGQDHVEKESLAAAVSSLLYTCQPYFNYLESTARSTESQNTHVPFDLRSKLLDFSQQLCEKLQQLLLTYCSYDLLSLDETEPNSVSHFCVGQTQLGQLKLTIFKYCKPTPYLARVNTELYKCMRWNVERAQDEQGGGIKDEKRVDYYFLCYEDIPSAHPEADRHSEGASHGNVVRMWSIGQWVQVNPDPKTENIHDWILCDVPQGSYHKLLFLGHDEPPSYSTTDYLLQLLFPSYTD